MPFPKQQNDVPNSPIEDGRLGIHVLSARYGESIIVTLPDSNWFVVDAFDGQSDGVECDHPVAAFIRTCKLEPQNCLFVLLTHFHEDHYSGIEPLLEGILPGKDFYTHSVYHNYQVLGQELGEALSRREAENATALGLDSLGRKVEAVLNRCGQQLVRANKWYPLHYWRSPSNVELIVKIFAPDDDTAGRLIGRFVKFCRAPRRNGNPSSPENTLLNNMSLSLAICYGRTRILLPGDLEYGGWRLVAADPDARGAYGRQVGNVLDALTLVKAPHHGAHSSFAPRLRRTRGGAQREILDKALAQESCRWLVCTHFHKGTSHLPDKEGLTRAINASVTVGVANIGWLLSHVHPSATWRIKGVDRELRVEYDVPHASPDKYRRLRSEYRDASLLLPAQRPEVNWVSATLNEKGGVLRWRGGSAARLITQAPPSSP